MAAPPCQDFTVSGAQYWKEKDNTGKTAKSIKLVTKTLEIIDYFDPHFWVIENPVGRLPQLVPQLGEPWYFQPFEFGDPWSKKTGLWGQFDKPKPKAVKPIRFSSHGSWISLLGGRSDKTKEIRSITSTCFAKAFYKANNKVKKKNIRMEQFVHLEFINDNSIELKSLPGALQKKLSLFKQMYKKLNDTVDEDRNKLRENLKSLDNELVEDLEEEFEDQLENNEVDEENDDILEKFYKKGIRIVGRTDLVQAGFKGELTATFIPVGDYCLQRIATFSFTFKIHRSMKNGKH